MKSRKIILFCGAALLAGSLLAACSAPGNGTAVSTGTEYSETAEPFSELEAEEEVEIELDEDESVGGL